MTSQNENNEEPIPNRNDDGSNNDENSISVDIPKLDQQEFADYKQNTIRWMILIEKDLSAVQLKVVNLEFKLQKKIIYDRYDRYYKY
jgi:hypothetical protein